MTDTKRVNDVTLFSNGIGYFRRVYNITPEGTKISIPFKKDHIGDVAASLQVFGDVKLNTPPSFTPSNSNATALNIDKNNAMRSLLSSLSGAKIKITDSMNKEKECTLLGLSADTVVLDKSTTTEDYIVVLTEGGGVEMLPFEYLKNVFFTEESVRTEIEKALKNNFQQIKPDSTMLDLFLSSTKEVTEATVQYTIPVAAWKMCYAIREYKGHYTLEGAAVIDNNTDEDWNNFTISVVTGNPISFATDIANVVVPNRKFINIVEGNVEGNVTVDEGYTLECAVGGGSPRGVARAACSPKMSVANYASFGLDATMTEMPQYSNALAESPGVEAKDVGDFCVFTSKEPISLVARKSAVVPMFSIPLDKAGVLFLYKEGNHSTRPYRTIKFKNKSVYSLGKGKTTIYNEGLFSGECVLEATKPGDNRILPHCLENGVRVSKEFKGTNEYCHKVKINDGSLVEDNVRIANTSYKIINKKNELFKMAVEHVNVFTDIEIQVNFKLILDGKEVEIKEQEKLIGSSGYRVYFELPADSTVTLEVEERMIQSYAHVLTYKHQLLRTVVNTRKEFLPLTENKDVIEAFELQKKIDDNQVKINESNEQKVELEQRIDRVSKLVEAAKQAAGHDTVSSWIQELDSANKDITTIDSAIKELQAETKKLNKEMQKVLAKIQYEWTL